MPDHLSPASRSAIMRAIRSKNTKPELRLRQALHQLGYRFTIHSSELPGKPDLVFSKRKKVIFVHGCFWHQHPDPLCRDAKRPTTNQEYWLPKLERTQQRDQQQETTIRRAGWDVLIVWECELSKTSNGDDRISTFLGPPKWESDR